MSAASMLQAMVDDSPNIVFFGGAGVSTESGIPDFRSAQGLYSGKHRILPEIMLSHAYFAAHPKEFFSFYREKMLYPGAMPNGAHKKLAELEAAGKVSHVITQNIDGLHQAAGSKNVLEVHGSAHRNTCRKCKKTYGMEAILHAPGIPRCPCGGILKPEVVLYGEPLDQQVMEKAHRAIAAAQMLIIGGTSLSVYPAAGLAQAFAGKYLVILNKTPTSMDDRADLLITDPIGETLQKLRV